jgi:hypothetical protein
MAPSIVVSAFPGLAILGAALRPVGLTVNPQTVSGRPDKASTAVVRVVLLQCPDIPA